MTKVYVVREDIYESDVLIQTNEIIGIYSSLKKSQNAMLGVIDKVTELEPIFTELEEKEITTYGGRVKGMTNDKTIELRFEIVPFEL